MRLGASATTVAYKSEANTYPSTLTDANVVPVLSNIFQNIGRQRDSRGISFLPES